MDLAKHFYHRKKGKRGRKKVEMTAKKRNGKEGRHKI